MSVLREIITRLTLQTDPAKLAQFKAQLGSAREETQKLTGALGGVAGRLAGIAGGLAAGLGFRAVTTELAEETHILNNHSKAVGMTVEEYSRLQAASAQFVEETGKDMRDFLADLADYGRDALANPTGSYAADLKALGVELKDSEGKLKSQFDLLLALSDAMTEVPLTAERMGIVSAIFSTGGLEMAEFLQLGREGIKAQMAAVEQAAITTERHVKVSKEFRGAMMGVALVTKQLRVEMGMRLMPTLTKLAKGFTTWWRGMDGGARKVQVLLGTLKLLSSILAVIVAVKLALFLKVAVVMTIAWTKAIWAAVAALGAMKIILLAIPIILGTLALLLEDIIVWSRGGDSAIGAFIDKFYDAPGILGKFARFLRDNTWEIIAFAEKVWEMAKSVPLWLWQIYDAARQWWGKLVEVSRGGVKGLMAAWSSGFARDLGATLWDWIADSLAALRARLMGAVSSAVTSVIDAVWSGLSGAGAGVSGWFGGIVSRVKGAARSVIDGVIEALGPLYPSLVSLFGALWQLGVALAKMFFALARIAWTLWTLKGKLIWAVVKAILPHALALGQRVIEVVVRILVRVAEWVGQAAAWIGEKVTWLIDNVVKPAIAWIGEAAAWLAGKAAWVASKVKVLVDWLGQAANWLITKVTELANWITEKVTWVADKATWVTAKIADGITWVAQKVADGAALVAKGLAYILDTYVTPAIQWLTTGVEWITQIFNDIADGIGGAFESAFNAVMTFARPIIDLIDGLKGTVDWAAEKLGLGGGSISGEAVQGLTDIAGALKAGDYSLSSLNSSTGPRLVSMGGVPVGPDGKPVGGTTNSVGTLQVNIQGSANMGPSELATAASQGVQEGMTKAAGRDLSVGGG